RPSWWSGDKTTLLDAMNYCLVEFMGGASLDATDPRARELFEYLESVSPDATAPALKYTVVKNIEELDQYKFTATAVRGRDVYSRACRGCHGEPHSGDDRVGGKTTIIPEDTINGPVCNPKMNPSVTDPLSCARTVVVEKVRHGKFFNIGGTMPLYYAE